MALPTPLSRRDSVVLPRQIRRSFIQPFAGSQPFAGQFGGFGMRILKGPAKVIKAAAIQFAANRLGDEFAGVFLATADGAKRDWAAE
jgi:hypothetical protein